MQPNRIDDPGHSDLRQHAIPPVKTGQIVCYETRTYLVSPTQEHATLDQVTQEHFDRTFGLNVWSLLFASQAGAGLMGAGGAIVLIGSIAGMIGTAGFGVYGASKAAVRSFARTWANELAPRGIRVNVVSPGPVDTALFASVPADMRDALTKLIPLGRLGRPEEVAAAALILGSDESSFVTGAELCVDGGMAQV